MTEKGCVQKPFRLAVNGTGSLFRLGLGRTHIVYLIQCVFTHQHASTVCFRPPFLSYFCTSPFLEVTYIRQSRTALQVATPTTLRIFSLNLAQHPCYVVITSKLTSPMRKNTIPRRKEYIWINYNSSNLFRSTVRTIFFIASQLSFPFSFFCDIALTF